MGQEAERPSPLQYPSAAEYSKALDLMFEYNEETVANIADEDLEVFEEEKKIKTRWGQHYDIEQLMEHAIVHILRHRRQIENFIKGFN